LLHDNIVFANMSKYIKFVLGTCIIYKIYHVKKIPNKKDGNFY
jgi:hypothetical protein